ncbi:MAG: hypothetical protein KDA87_17425 [Planctomycetales bacterium]|nr:hypothetical protein [Planctomycetales bacterium]
MFWDVLLTVLLAFHLLAMNVASAAPLVTPFLEARGSVTGNDARLGKWLSWFAVYAFVVGILLGLGVAGALWLAGETAFWNTLPRFAYKIKWGVAELAFYLACMVPYAMVWDRAVRGGRIFKWLHRTVAVLAATNLLYHFPVLFRVIVLVANGRSGKDGANDIRAAEFRELGFTPEVISFACHFALASVAVVGVALMWRTVRMPANATDDSLEPNDSDWQTRAIQRGARITLFASSLQILVGIWVAYSLPRVSLNKVVGQDMAATACLGVSALLTFLLLQLLTPLAFGEWKKSAVVRCKLLLMLIVVLMTHTLRKTY